MLACVKCVLFWSRMKLERIDINIIHVEKRALAETSTVSEISNLDL